MEQENRVLIRPKIKWVKPLIYTLLVLTADAVITALLCATVHFGIHKLNTMAFVILACLLFLLIISAVIVYKIKEVSIFLILLYQRFAPASVRLRCVFTPSCSEYMKMCIEKYGFIEGVKKGWDRLDRCHYPNCGDDYP